MAKVPAPLTAGKSPAATFERYKVPILAAAGLAVAGLAFVTSRSATPTPATSTAEGQVSGTTGYDSTASDVYNAIQPQLEHLQRLWDERQETTAPTPTPAPPPATRPPLPRPPIPAPPPKALRKLTARFVPVGTVPTPPRYTTPVREY